MKKFKRILVAAGCALGCLAMIGLIYLSVIELSESPVGEKYIANKEYTVEAEMQKDYYLVQILSKHEKAIDAYGDTLKEGKWYMVSRKSGMLAPLGVGTENYYSWNDLEYADVKNSSSKMRMNGNVESAQIDNFTCRSYEESTPNRAYVCNIKVKMLLFGPQYVHYKFDGELKYFIKSSK